MKEQRKQARIEGDGASQLVQLIRNFGHNQDVNFELGTVTSAPPSLKIKLDGVDTFELDSDDLIVAEYLTNHKRRVNITSDSVTIPMSVEGYISHVHDIHGITISDAQLEFLDELSVGDRVILANYNNGQSYIVLDRAVRYSGA